MIHTASFNSLVSNRKHLLIKITKGFLKKDTLYFRSVIFYAMKSNLSKIFIDLQEVDKIDLGGINEIIHSYYNMMKRNQDLVLIYRNGSEVENWVKTTGLHKYVKTAMLPAV